MIGAEEKDKISQKGFMRRLPIFRPTIWLTGIALAGCERRLGSQHDEARRKERRDNREKKSEKQILVAEREKREKKASQKYYQ